MQCKIKDGKYICVRYTYNAEIGKKEKKVVEARSSGAQIQRQSSGSGKRVFVC